MSIIGERCVYGGRKSLSQILKILYSEKKPSVPMIPRAVVDCGSSSSGGGGGGSSGGSSWQHQLTVPQPQSPVVRSEGLVLQAPVQYPHQVHDQGAGA